MADETGRISISEEKLKIALLEMEARLRIYFDEQLKHKAEQATVVELTHHMGAQRRGEFNPAQVAVMKELVTGVLEAQEDRGWTRRERMVAVIAVAISALALIFSVYFGVRAASAQHASPQQTSATAGEG